ncbi:MAG: preprotein translocase subunit YajC [Burkholderiaceae bacterium]|nr:MAG: preprotein translocase subunit YajC [Burkholderiaceae bacterium]
MFISEAFAQSATAASPASSLMSFLPLIGMFAIMYFLMIRPQMKRQKEHKALVDGLSRGNEVVLSSGLMGKITKVGESVVSVEIAHGVEVQVQRHSVANVLPNGSIK